MTHSEGSPAHEAQIIAVGTELLSHTRSETNSVYLTEILSGLGIPVGSKRVVRDREQEIADAVADALKTADILLITGGLGPTSDDVTREAVGRALSLGLETHPEAMENLRRFYTRVDRPMTQNNLRQALVPEGAEVIQNPNGTAPGLFLRESEKLIFLLPGPPRELKPMVENDVVPRIQEYKSTRRRYSRHLRVASMGESTVDFEVQPIYRAHSNVSTTILSSPGVIDLFFFWEGKDDEKVAGEELEGLVLEIRNRLGAAVFTESGEELEDVVGCQLKKHGLWLATAESCTGGLLGKLITDVPGSSAYFLGGIITYSNELKTRLLNVRRKVLDEQGAVSPEVAEEMALGVCRLTGADVGLSTTGVAGPGGGTEEKPVGLVYVGLSRSGKTSIERLLLPGDRNVVRLRTARFALDWLRRSLDE